MYAHAKKTGMPLLMYRDRKQCPDCGSRMYKVPCVDADHFVYTCPKCSALFKDRGNKTSWDCRIWQDPIPQ